jgi:hypothetical protein
MTGQRTAPPALTEPAAETAAVPRFYRVASRREDTADTVTLELTEPAHPFEPVPAFAPGQFAMLTAFGVGEVPISVSGLGDSGGGRDRPRAAAPRGAQRARRPVSLWPDRAAGRRAEPR